MTAGAPLEASAKSLTKSASSYFALSLKKQTRKIIFLKAGSLIEVRALIAGAGLIALFLAVKMATKFVGILPLTRYFKFDNREGMYTTMMMSTGLTFGSISEIGRMFS